ncbi:16S rRNA (cytosine(1402)-N(4))-methyltransferase RsmH [Patescibacteria group bacterium]|nr:16S rRNA (cytosine(1402)-N(4))-methyltransferase RsmH [Patescibacteria group bacterium]MBU1867941.1 16S rRNA (cytosine(1402)-N(4))-methyltransferase RsmH [Patescibacteria group bacterium]
MTYQNETKFHEPVFVSEVLQYLKVKPGGKYIDATVGGGGHSAAIIDNGGILLGIDVDPGALSFAEARLAANSKRNPSSTKSRRSRETQNTKLIRGSYRNLKTIAERNNFSHVDGILFDLGMSTWQIKKSGLGFSFMANEPLDMRMDPKLKVTAADLVNGLSEKELVKLFITYGNEVNAKRIAKNIINARHLTPITHTLQLVEVIGYWRRRNSTAGKIHPATKVFQALRVAVNDELNSLRTALPEAIKLLTKEGRLVVISFHSLEDRIVKQFLKEQVKLNRVRILTPKPITPSTDEVDRNPSARSAKLRAAEKI